MKGGYYMVDCAGLELHEDDPQSIAGIWQKAVEAMAQDKPIAAYNCTYADAPVSPVPCFGWYLSAAEIVIVGGTLHIHVKSDNTATVLDKAS